MRNERYVTLLCGSECTDYGGSFIRFFIVSRFRRMFLVFKEMNFIQSICFVVPKRGGCLFSGKKTWKNHVIKGKEVKR